MPSYPGTILTPGQSAMVGYYWTYSTYCITALETSSENKRGPLGGTKKKKMKANSQNCKEALQRQSDDFGFYHLSYETKWATAVMSKKGSLKKFKKTFQFVHRDV